MGAMSTTVQKITFGEMREQGIRGVLIYCADYHCSHSLVISGDRWPDETQAVRSRAALSAAPAASAVPMAARLLGRGAGSAMVSNESAAI
jgi:hypothetical protein